MAQIGAAEAEAEVEAAAAPAASTPSAIDRLRLSSPPPMDPVYVQYETEAQLTTPPRRSPPVERQPQYVTERRELSARMMAPGERDHALSQGIVTRTLTVPSSLDGFAIPVLEYRRHESGAAAVAEPLVIVIYIHGGGLHIGAADSEDLPCRRIVKETQLPGPDGRTTTTARNVVLYSIEYRLMPQHPATTCLADCVDVVRHIRAGASSPLSPSPTQPQKAIPPLFLVGSSSGGELAALVAQEMHSCAAATATPAAAIQGVVLRCPVTSDVFKGDQYVPAALRHLHTSAANLAFQSSQLGPMRRALPRDGLPRMPLEADPDTVLRHLPPHWIQVCTNDMLYSDGICYAKALENAGVPVRVDVITGFPHTFWLPCPWMDRALEADRAVLSGLAWLAAGGKD